MQIPKLSFNIRKGNPVVLGAVRQGNGVNFAVSIKDCPECDLIIYEKKGTIAGKLHLDSNFKTGDIFCVFVEDIDIEKYNYCYEVMGKEFADPYSRKISGREVWGKPIDKKKSGLVLSSVVDDDFDWEDDKCPLIGYEDAIFYKLHVRGYTKHASAKVQAGGTFKGLEQKIDYIKELGVTSVILMPVYEFDEIIYDKYLMGPEDITFVEYKEFLEEQKKGEDPVVEHYKRHTAMQGVVPYKINYWGYGTEECYYFAPKSSYASDPDNAVNEFKHLIKSMHKAGLECIMEFNFKQCVDKQFVYECFRYWMLEYHVDGFKYNAGAINGEFVAADPLLSDKKIICEGWNENAIYNGKAPLRKNLGMMNDDYMINVRKFLKGDEEQAGDFAYKFRRNSVNVGIINYITNANGFTMHDLFSYDIKHNEDNLENGNDGTDYNYSWNCGFEGKTRKNKVLSLRKKQIRNAFTLLLLSQASPMILAGDEILNSQNGNNNAYCIDDETTWINWNTNAWSKANLEFVKTLIKLRKSHVMFHPKNELRVMDYVSLGSPDISYHGTRAWYPEFNMYSRTLGIMLYGKYAGSKADSSFYIAINMHWEDHEFDIPRLPDSKNWHCILDCSLDSKENEAVSNDEIEDKYLVKARDVVVFEALPEEPKKKTKRVKNNKTK